MKRAGLMAAAVLAAGTAWAGAFDAARVPAGATWVVHADLSALRPTPMGQFLVNELGSGVAGNKLAAFAAIFGFDPLKDLQTITLCGKSKDPTQSVVMVAGAFDKDRLVTLLEANDTYESQPFGAYTIHSWVDEKKPAEGRQYGCVHPSGTLVISHGREMIEETLQVLDGKRPSLDAGKVFGAELLSAAPFFMAGANAMGGADGAPSAAVLKQADAAQLSLSEQGTDLVLRARLTARDGQGANNMLAVAQGMIAVAMLGQEKNPALAQLAQAAQVRLDGKTVRVDIVYPEARAIAAIEERMNAAAAQ